MYEYKTRVAPSDVYADGCMTPTSMARLMQDCSQLWLESEPRLTEWLKTQNVIMVIASRQMDIIRPPHIGERLTTTTSIYDVKGALGFRNTFIRDEQRCDVAKCWALGAFVSGTSGKLEAMPDDVANSLTIDPKHEMVYAPRKIKLPKVEPEIMPTLQAGRGVIDINNHINNAQYTRMAWEYMPKGFHCQRMRVEFKEQGYEGCTITPYVYRDSERTVISLNDNSNKPYAIVEFS